MSETADSSREDRAWKLLMAGVMFLNGLTSLMSPRKMPIGVWFLAMGVSVILRAYAKAESYSASLIHAAMVAVSVGAGFAEFSTGERFYGYAMLFAAVCLLARIWWATLHSART